MIDKRLIFILLIISQFTFSQIKGIVKDSISGEPIPYVNIGIENENVGTTSEENGQFQLNYNNYSKRIIFSSLGYETKKVLIKNQLEILLKPSEIKLNEVVLLGKKNTKEIEIGKSKNSFSQAFDNGPRIDVKYFPYKQKYKTTKFIKEVTVTTDNEIQEATFKLHFYNVDENGFPGNELIKNALLVKVKKGVLKTILDISDYNLIMPQNGIFVGFERLLIEKNKIEKIIKDYNSNTEKTKITYYPLVLYKIEERDFTFTFYGGKWNKEVNKEDNQTKKLTIYEPAINLILSN